MAEVPQKIAVLGGSGALGRGLAGRWAKAGLNVIIGSRDEQKAKEAAASLRAELRGRGVSSVSISSASNLEAARLADIVTLTVPYANHRATLEQVVSVLSGKILIDVTVPLRPPKVGTVQLPAEGSATVAAQRFLGDGVRVVSAFQNVSAVSLRADAQIECDVLVCGDDKDSCGEVIKLAEVAGMRAFYAGPVANSAATEALTSLLITINRAHKIHSGIKITGFH